jgi:hypothetical protein
MTGDAVAQAGLGVGVASLIGQVFSACVAGLDIRAKSLNFGHDLLIFNAKLDMLSARLKAWGQSWGISEQKHLESPRFQEFQAVATNSLLVIYHLIESLTTLKKEFPYFEGKYDMSTIALAAGLEQLCLVQDSTSLHAQIEMSMSSLQEDSSVKERAQWIITSEETEKLLQDLDALVLGLERLLPPPQDFDSQALVFSKYLASDNTDWLDALAQAERPSAFSGPAELKSLSTKLQTKLILAKTTVTPKRISIKERDLDLIEYGSDQSRTVATYQGRPVLVEWKTTQRPLEKETNRNGYVGKGK